MKLILFLLVFGFVEVTHSQSTPPELYFRNTGGTALPMRPGPGVATGDRNPRQIRPGEIVRLIDARDGPTDDMWLQIEPPPGATCPETGCWVARTWNGNDRFEQLFPPDPGQIINPYQNYIRFGAGEHSCDISNINNLQGLGGVRFKSREELRDWMKCFTAPTPAGQNSNDPDQASGYDLYRQIETYIESASQATGLPYAFLACKYWRESRYDRTGVSRSEAFGFGQFKLDTMFTMERINNMDGDRMALEQQLAQTLENPESPSSPPKRWRRFSEDVVYLRRKTRNLARRDFMRSEYRDYTTSVQSRPGPYSSYPQSMEPGQFCSGPVRSYVQRSVQDSRGNSLRRYFVQHEDGSWRMASDESVVLDTSQHPGEGEQITRSRCDRWEFFNPVWSMGASALYLKDLAITLDQRYSVTPVPIDQIAANAAAGEPRNYVERTPQNIDDLIFQTGESNPMDFLLLVSAAYNAGPAGFVEDMMNVGRSLDDWLAYMGDNPNLRETRDHMKSIRDCMAPGVFDLSTGETQQRRCER